MINEFKKTIHINASPEEVWDALVNPVKIEFYMFGSIARSDWKPESPLEFYMKIDEKDILVVKGKIINSDPPFLLEHTLFPAASTIEDIPDNYLTITYLFEPGSDGCRLTLNQSGFSTAAEGAKRYEDTVKGWEIALPKLIEVIEK